MTEANTTFGQKPIAEQKAFLENLNIVVTDMVAVTAEEFPLYVDAFAEQHGFTEFGKTNGYLSPVFDINDAALIQVSAKVNFPGNIRAGVADAQGNRIENRFVLPAINSNASVKRANKAHLKDSPDVALRAGMLVAAANGPVYAALKDEANNYALDENGWAILTETAEASPIPVAGPVIVYDGNTACGAIEFAFQLPNINFAGYFKGGKYDGNTLEHQLVAHHGREYTTVALVDGNRDVGPAYEQTGDELELAKAKNGEIEDSLTFLVPKDLYDQVKLQYGR